MSKEIKLKPCPFCGSDDIEAVTQASFAIDQERGWVHCNSCHASIICDDEPEHFEKVEEDLYRKVPKISGIDAAVERWNRRVSRSK